MPIHISTPLVKSDRLSQTTEKNIWLKMEALQPSGSFKLRGVGHACEEYVRRGKTRFVSSSGGNAGLAVAYAGAQLHIPVTVVVPLTTTQRARELISLQGAELVVTGATWAEANEHVQQMLTEQDAFIHPFDDPLLWEGHATMIDEVAVAGLRPDAVMVSVGGGGLLSGVHAGLQRNGWADVPIIAVETTGAACYARSIEAGKRVTLEAIDTVATSLGAKQVAEQAFDIAMSHSVKPVVVSDFSAVTACSKFLDDHRILVEPACGASLSLAYENSPVLREFKNILIIVCGGAVATAEQLRQWSGELMDN